MKRIYCSKRDLSRVLHAESLKQEYKNRFVNMSVKPYKGRKYGRDYVVINIG